MFHKSYITHLESEIDWLKGALSNRDQTITELLDRLAYGKRPERLIEPTAITPPKSSKEDADSDILQTEGMRDPMTQWEAEAKNYTLEQIRKGADR
jgi:hypothetical protein